MKVFDRDFLSKICVSSQNSARKRQMVNIHEQLDNKYHRMINVLQPSTYICPHKHENPDKFELFVIIQGELLIVVFDDNGNITNHIILSHQSGNYLVELQPRIFHTIIPLSVNTIVFECKEGPYCEKTDKIFATWAPKEGEKGSMDFNKEIFNKLAINFPEFI